MRSGMAGREFAEDRLRRAILDGELAPGHRIVELDLAADYGVTRNGVRLALDALVAEGLVERVPHRGARVRRVSTDEAIAITECRLALEGLVAAKAAEHATDAELEELAAHAQRMRAAVAAGEPLRYSALIRELQTMLQRMARQPTAAALLERLGAQVVRHQFQLSLRPGRPQVSLRELLAVVEAVTARRPGLAEEAARAHLRSVIAALAETDAAADPAGTVPEPHV